MRTDPIRPQPTPLVSALDRFRRRTDRLRRWAAGLGPGARLGLGLAALAALAAAAYWATTTAPEPAAPVYLFAGHRYAPDVLDQATALLAAHRIQCHIDKQGRIAVPLERKNEAMNLLTKNKLGPESLKAIAEELLDTPIWQGVAEKQDRQALLRIRQVEFLIQRFRGIASADVLIRRLKTRPGSLAPQTVTALVYLKGEDGRPIPNRTIAMIQDVLCTSEPDLPRDAVTIIDDASRAYLVAGNPASTAQSQARAREEEWTEKILEGLSLIEGVRVFVTLEPASAASPAPAPAPAPVPT
ncbi:MAG: hypothetical protein IRY99_26735, partial [Isosphaeraceae bacterium]|nr:hypothetical protein [Isosphaeraceae bacterium]